MIKKTIQMQDDKIHFPWYDAHNMMENGNHFQGPQYHGQNELMSIDATSRSSSIYIAET